MRWKTISKTSLKNRGVGGKLTKEERQRFIDMNVFDKIKGNDQTRIEWLNTIYQSFLAALDFKPIGWREEEKDIPQF